MTSHVPHGRHFSNSRSALDQEYTSLFWKLTPAGPDPVLNSRRVVTDPLDIPPVIDQPVSKVLLRVCANGRQPGHPVYYVNRQVKAVQLVEGNHVERRCRGPLLLIAAHVEIAMVRATVRQAMD